MLGRDVLIVRGALGMLVLGAFSFVADTADADIYTYIDAQGNVVISSQPQRGNGPGKVDKISSGKGSKKKTRDIMPIMPSDGDVQMSSWYRFARLSFMNSRMAPLPSSGGRGIRFSVANRRFIENTALVRAAIVRPMARRSMRPASGSRRAARARSRAGPGHP